MLLSYMSKVDEAVWMDRALTVGGGAGVDEVQSVANP